MVWKLLILIFVLISLNSFANALKLNICTDNIPQVPYIFFKNEKVEGIEIDILKMSLKRLKNKVNIDLHLEVLPWSRCIYLAEKGEVDGVFIVSYSDERSKFIDFPLDAGPNETKPCSSKFAISCFSYVVITLNSSKFEYKGKLEDLPKPVRVARGYSIVSELEKSLKNNIEIGKSDDLNVKKLIRDQKGSAIVFSPFLIYLKKEKNLSNKIKINEKKYAMKSYYLAFSKKSLLSNKEKELVWKEIGNISNNKKIMNKIFLKYSSL